MPKTDNTRRGLEPNQASRIFLTLALYHRAEARVTPEAGYYGGSEDVVRIKGSYFSNKFPGSSLWLLIFAPLVDVLTPGRSLDFDDLAYGGRILALTLPFLWMLYSVGRFLEQRTSFLVAWGAVLALALGTNAGVYTGFYMGHVPAAIFVWMSFMMAGRRAEPWVIGSGVCAGMAVITDAITAPLAAAMFVWALAQGEEGRKSARFFLFLAGLLPMVGILLAYNQWVTGNPFVFPYHFETSGWMGDKGLKLGFYGFSLPTAQSLYGVILSPARGVLFHSPWMVILIFGWLWVFRIADPAKRRLSIAVMTLFWIFLVWSASYGCWYGGYSFGVRFLIPIYAFAAVGAALLYQEAPGGICRMLARGAALLIPLSVLIHFLGLLTAPVWPYVSDGIQVNTVKTIVFPILKTGYHISLIGPPQPVPAAAAILLTATALPFAAYFYFMSRGAYGKSALWSGLLGVALLTGVLLAGWCRTGGGNSVDLGSVRLIPYVLERAVPAAPGPQSTDPVLSDNP